MVDKVEGKDLFVYWQATRGTAPRKCAHDKEWGIEDASQ